MAKSKKSKILAMALCASVMTGIYAAPVMAENLSVKLDGQGITADEINVDTIFGSVHEYHDGIGTLTITKSALTTALAGIDLTLNSVTANTISTTGNKFNVGTDGNVSAVSGDFGGTVINAQGINVVGSKPFKLGQIDVTGRNLSNVGWITASDTINTPKINGVKVSGDGDNGLTISQVELKNGLVNGADVTKLNINVGGITRTDITDGVGTTTIEGDFAVNGKDNTFGSKNGSFTVDAEDGTFTAAKSAFGAFKVREGYGETVIAGSIISSKDQFGNQGTFNGSNLNLQSPDHTRNTSIDAGRAYFVKDGSGTSIDGGAITAKSLLLDGKDVGETIFGIERETITDEIDNEVSTTTIEGALKVSDNGLISNADGSFTVDSNGGLVAGGGTFAADMTGIRMSAPVEMILQGDYNYNDNSVIDLGATISDIDDRLDVLEDKTQNIKPGTGAGTGTGEGEDSGLTGGEDTVPDTAPGHTGITGDVTVGGNITAGEDITAEGDVNGTNGNFTGDVDITGDITAGTGHIGNTTIDGDGINTGNGNFSGEVTVGNGTDKTTINGGNITTGDITAGTGNFTGNVDIIGNITAGTGTIGGIGMEEGTIKTGGTTINGSGIETGNGTFTGDVNVNGAITAGTGTIGGVGMKEGTITAENGGTIGGAKFDENGMTVGKGTDIKDGNITVKGDEGKVEIGKGDVAIFDEYGEKVTSIQHNYDEINRVEEKFDGEVNRLDNRISKVEDRIDKVGAMSAAIANLRTMGYDPAAPTEIAVGVGQYRSETGVALGMFHYPNKDFMLSLSVSTSGDEVMGGIGATWKFGRKSPEKVLAAEKEKAAKAKLAKAEAMKKAAKEAKIKAQQERHAKLAAERAAQAEAAK